MKILALGGSGGMGRFVVRSLVNHEKIKKIFVADLNASSAKNFASNFDDRVEGLELDITIIPMSHLCDCKSMNVLILE